jgi:hypothetical protein
MPKKYKENITIDVLPYLSIMVSVLNIICLIIVVMVMNIALNPKALKVISFAGLYKGEEKTPSSERVQKIPSYLDCSESGVSIFPGNATVSRNELQQPDNAVDKLLDKVQANSEAEYVILLVRPNSLPVYRLVRRMVSQRALDIAYDTLEVNAKIDWAAEAKALNIRLSEP